MQGDFIVPASREDIIDDTGPSGSWNTELRAELPGLFVRSLEDYKRLHTSVADLNGWYQCIPLQGEVRPVILFAWQITVSHIQYTIHT